MMKNIPLETKVISCKKCNGAITLWGKDAIDPELNIDNEFSTDLATQASDRVEEISKQNGTFMTEKTNSAMTKQVKTKPCPFCSELIIDTAKKCRYCGEFLDEYLRKECAGGVAAPVVRKWVPGIAAVCSFIIPGLGQIYKGQVINGLFWMLTVAVGYLILFVPGLILHFLCILGAISGDPYK